MSLEKELSADKKALFSDENCDRSYCNLKLGFSKAFDSVRHDLLLQKLYDIGIRGSLLNWIINYLSNRIQIVNVNGHFSSERRVSSGVIQGSVLGPLFFTIFVNDVDEVIHNSSIIKYADDIRIYRSFKSDCQNQNIHSQYFQDDINALYDWSLKWDLKFNIAKCCVLHFGHTNNKTDYKLNDTLLQKKKVEKDLGIFFSVNLKFHEHIDSIVSRANRQLGIITKVFRRKKAENIIPLYKTLVRPLLEYNSIIWSPYSNKYNDRIEFT